MADNAERLKELTKKFLGWQLYIIHTTPNAPREELDPLLPDHLEHQVRLEKLGVMFAAAPMANPDGAPAGGPIVIRARDFAAAKPIGDSDPFQKSDELSREHSLRCPTWSSSVTVMAQGTLLRPRVPCIVSSDVRSVFLEEVIP